MKKEKVEALKRSRAAVEPPMPLGTARIHPCDPPNSRAARTSLPQAALPETGNGKRETAASGVPLCKYIHFDGRPCQNPVHRKTRTAEVGLCFQHAIRTRLHPVMEARRAANALRAAAELKLTAVRRAQRTINDLRARAIRPFAHIPILNTYENLEIARRNIEYAAAVGAFDARTIRVLLNTLRIAGLAIKHTKGPMFAEGYTPPGFVKGPMGFTPLDPDLRKAHAARPKARPLLSDGHGLPLLSDGHDFSRAVKHPRAARTTLPKAALL